MARFDRLNNQAPAQSLLEKDSSPVGRSAHDFSYIHSGNAFFGALIPIDCFDVVPNEDLQINVASLLEFRNPTTRQLLNSCRVYFHAYYNRLDDLWEGAKNWLDKGRSGKISLTRPNLIYHVDNYAQSSGATLNVNACTPLSLLDYLGLPAEKMQLTGHNQSENWNALPLFSFRPAIDNNNPNYKFTVQDLRNSTDYFPADCAMAYQRNWRDYYSNKNLLQGNKYWFPENEEHFILSYSCENACAILYEDEDFSSNSQFQTNFQIRNICSHEIFASSIESINMSKGSTYYQNCPTAINPNESIYFAPNLSALKFRQYRGDRFTTALPFPDLIRGDIPLMQITQDSVLNVKGSNDSANNSTLTVKQNAFNSIYGVGNDSETLLRVSIPGSSITMSDIYTLETLTAFKRRMAMTNGDYNDMIEAQFGVNPHVHDRQATYIGGYYQDFAFNSVTQTSESSSSPLGTKAGQGVSSGNGSIGSFHVPDYGWIQIYMSIVPDVMYTSGKPRMFSKKSNLEMYFPIFNNLPAQAIRYDELYVSGVPTSDANPFAYEDRYAEYKSRVNRVSGFIGLPHSVAAFDSAKIMSRRFSQQPSFNTRFVTMLPESTDMEVFTVVDEPPIDFSCGISVRRVFPGPYTAIEGSLSSPALMR